MKKYILIILGTLFAVNSFAQDKVNEELWNKIQKEVIEDKSFVVEVNQMSPLRKGIIPTNGYYAVKIQNDSIFSALPYYGRATSLPYGGGQALNFEAPIKDYKVEIMKKNRLRVTLKTDSKDDHYTYIYTIFANGHTTFDIIALNRESISFIGDYISIDDHK